MTIVLGLTESDLKEKLYKIYMVSFWTEPFLNFWIFMKKYPHKKKI